MKDFKMVEKVERIKLIESDCIVETKETEIFNQDCIRKQLYSCKKCLKVFKNIHMLKRHDLLHTGEKPFSCQYCGFRSRLKHNMKDHEKSHQNEKPFSCAKCFKRFKYANHLKIHDRIHLNSDGKLYNCQYCTKEFKFISDVKVHERVHTGEKPFSCTFCKKTFNQSSVQKRHELMMHTSEKPNSCQYCDRKFRVQINIKWHEKRCEMHPNKILKSKNLNKEKSKINEIENETLLSDNSIGEKHCNYSDGSPGEKELLSAISSIECTTIENLEDFNMTKKNNKARTSRNGWNSRPIPIY